MSKKADTNLYRPAATPEAREQQLSALAMDLAEKQMREGTASPSVITHFLKVASPRETMERDSLGRQNDLAAAKAEALRSERQIAEMISEAMNAFKSYSPTGQDYIPEDPIVMQPVNQTTSTFGW